MRNPRIAIVGSIDEARQYLPPITDALGAKKACEELGAELAEAGCRLVVYSGKDQFAELGVVRGYLGSGAFKPKSIEVRAPVGKVAFDEFPDYRDAFDFQSDSGGDWEVSYYRSIMGVDGALLVGGGRSTHITGLIAIALQKSIVAVATFGGSALKVWSHLDHEHHGNGNGIDVAAMAAPWNENSARLLVRSIIEQLDYREREHRATADRQRREAWNAQMGTVVIAGLLVLLVAGLAATWGWQLGPGPSIALLALLPMLAGAAGALIRTNLDGGREWGRSAVLGGGAGLITGLLYIASQLVGAPEVLGSSEADSIRRLLFFVLPIGFVAGLTFDAIYRSLRRKDVSQAATLDAMTSGSEK